MRKEENVNLMAYFKSIAKYFTLLVGLAINTPVLPEEFRRQDIVAFLIMCVSCCHVIW